MIYFDNAATTYPKPAAVVRAIRSFIKYRAGNPGRGGHALSMKAARTVYECRSKLASYFGAPSAEYVCFTGGCTEALNCAIKGCVKQSDTVITSDVEHNSVRRPLLSVQANIKMFDTDKSEDETLAFISEGIKSGASAVICTYASNVFPVVLPINKIGRICRENGVPFIVDGAQAAGIYDIDILRDNIDILCIPSHKGLYGVPGCGAMIFSPGYDIRSHKPLLYGGSGINTYDEDMPPLAPERFEAGTLPTAAIAALSAGIDFVNSVGSDRIRRSEEQISERIQNELSREPRIKLYKPGVGNILCFNVEGMSCERVASELDKHGICVRAGLHCSPDAHKKTAPDGTGAVRISFSYFNKLSEADVFCDVIHRIIRS